MKPAETQSIGVFCIEVCENVVEGHCVMFDEKYVITYVGPLNGSPFPGNGTVLVHLEDFKKFKKRAEERKTGGEDSWSIH